MKKISARKILQTLYYIQQHAPVSSKKYDIMYILKIVFFAVRFHLRNYGTPFLNITFYAMRRGPVASEVMDIIQGKMPYNMNSAEIELLKEVENIGEYDYEIKKQDTDELPSSFLQSLDFAIDNFGEYDPFQLSEISHSYPEWKKHEEKLLTEKRVLMNYEDFFNNPDEMKLIPSDPFFEADEEFLSVLREDYLEHAISC